MASQKYLEVLGRRIRAIRLSLGLNKAEFARRLEPNKNTNGSAKVSTWEEGRVSPRSAMLVKIANLGNVSVDYLTEVPKDYVDIEDCPYCHYDKVTTDKYTGPHMFPEYKGHRFGKEHEGIALDIDKLMICHSMFMLDEHQHYCRMCGSDLVRRRNHELG